MRVFPRFLLLLLVGAVPLLALPGPAIASSKPAPTTPGQATEYRDVLRHDWSTVRALSALYANGWLVGDDPGLPTRAAAAHTAIQAARTHLDAVPALSGDPGLRAAVLHGLDETDWLAGDGVAQMVPLLETSPPTQADQDRLEVLWTAWSQRRAASDAAVAQAEMGFDARFAIPAPPDAMASVIPIRPALNCPQIVTVGSQMPANFHAVFIARYRNFAKAQADALAEGYRRMVSTFDMTALDGARLSYRATVVEIQARIASMEPFRGDATLKDRLTHSATDVLAVLDGDLARCAETAKQEKLSKKQVDDSNALLARVTFAMRAAFDRTTRAEEAFDANWQIDTIGRLVNSGGR